MRRAAFSLVGLSTLLSLGLAVGLALAAGQSTRISVLIGLVSAAIGLGISGFIAARDQLESIEERRTAAMPLLNGLAAVPELERPISQITRSIAEAKSEVSNGDRGPFLPDRAIDCLRSFCADLDGITQGTLPCRTKEEELRFVELALDQTKERVRAVATRGAEWWGKPESQAYFKAYEEHAGRLEMTRIFLVPQADFGALKPVLERHHTSGIDTYALDRDKVDKPHGIVLFDSFLLHTVRQSTHGEQSPVAELTDVAERIREAEEYFDYLLRLTGVLDDQFVMFRPGVERS